MSNKLMAFISLLSAILLIACGEDKVPEEMSQVINLVSPESQSNVFHEDVLFQWETEAEGPFLLTIALDSNYSDIHIDTTTESQQIVISDLLPNTRYYWEVSNNNISAKSEFMTENIFVNISEMNGIASVREYNEAPMAGIDFDTTYVEFIEFDFADNELVVTSEFDSFTAVYELIFTNLDEKRTSFNVGGGGSNFSQLTYFYEKDSIFIRRHSGGIAGGRRWLGSIKK